MGYILWGECRYDDDVDDVDDHDNDEDDGRKSV